MSSIAQASGVAIARGVAPRVFPLIANWPLDHDIAVLNLVTDFGDGYELRENLNLPYTRADGFGTLAAYGGQNKFTLQLKTRTFAGDAKLLWSFYKARKGNLESFYFYNVPDERATIDLTGADTHGRYLVRFNDPSLSREKFTLLLFNHALTVIEVRA